MSKSKEAEPKFDPYTKYHETLRDVTFQAVDRLARDVAAWSNKNEKSPLTEKKVATALKSAMGNYEGARSGFLNAVFEKAADGTFSMEDARATYSVSAALLLREIQHRNALPFSLVVYRGIDNSRLTDPKKEAEELKFSAAQAAAVKKFQTFLKDPADWQRAAGQLNFYFKPPTDEFGDPIENPTEEQVLDAQRLRRESFIKNFKKPDVPWLWVMQDSKELLPVLIRKPSRSTLLQNQLRTAKVGDEITFSPFTSTSLSPDVAESFSLTRTMSASAAARNAVIEAAKKANTFTGWILDISLPKGTPFAQMGYGIERETLLPPCMSFLVTRVYMDPKTRTQHVSLKVHPRRRPPVPLTPPDLAFLTRIALTSHESPKDAPRIFQLVTKSRCTFKAVSLGGTSSCIFVSVRDVFNKLKITV